MTYRENFSVLKNNLNRESNKVTLKALYSINNNKHPFYTFKGLIFYIDCMIQTQKHCQHRAIPVTPTKYILILVALTMSS